MRFTFKKYERLSSKLLITELFTEGKAISRYPLRILVHKVGRQDDAPAKVLISVPKKKFKSAVKRNRIKRQIREAYRKNKHILQNGYEDYDSKQLLIGIIYTGKTIPDSSEVEKKLILILHLIIKNDVKTDR